VRRRAIHALRSLSRFDNEILRRIPSRVKSLLNIKRPEPSVIYAVLHAIVDILEVLLEMSYSVRALAHSLLST
jgi:hypothetical protein